MADDAPPPYQIEAKSDPPPVYPQLEQQQPLQSEEAAPPPAAFGQVPPNIQYPDIQQQTPQQQQPIVIQAPPITQGGESYQHVPTSSGPGNIVNAGEENAMPRQHIIYVQQNNGYPGQQRIGHAEGMFTMSYIYSTTLCICFFISLSLCKYVHNIQHLKLSTCSNHEAMILENYFHIK